MAARPRKPCAARRIHRCVWRSTWAVKVALEVAWVTAARGGDVLRIRTKEVEVKTGGTKVRFVVGKTASRQPYTVNTAPLSQSAREYVLGADPEGWLFPGVRGDDLRVALRRADPRLEQRSMRRGALQHLAAEGVGDVDLLAYSQHRQVDTLRRYLNFGWHSAEGVERAKRAAGLTLE